MATVIVISIGEKTLWGYHYLILCDTFNVFICLHPNQRGILHLRCGQSVLPIGVKRGFDGLKEKYFALNIYPTIMVIIAVVYYMKVFD